MVETVVEEAIEGYAEEDLPLGSYAAFAGAFGALGAALLLATRRSRAQWVAAVFVYGLAVQPRATRLVASMFAVKAILDALQLAYRAGEERR